MLSLRIIVVTLATKIVIFRWITKYLVISVDIFSSPMHASFQKYMLLFCGIGAYDSS